MSEKKTPIISRRGATKARPHQSGVSPRATHGTQVRFNVVCARCGASDTLPFVPKTQGAMLCRACAEEVFGPDWAHGRELPAKRDTYEITCAKCGKPDRVPFEPKPEREYLCRGCMRGEEQPSHERLKRMKKIE